VRYILRTGGDCYTEEEAEKEAKRIISKVRAEGIKAGGNAIVHQVALQIFKSINQFEKNIMSKEHIATYIYLRNRGKIAEEIVSRALLVLKLKNGSTVRMPITRQIRKAVIR
jgi:hypothetical protein